MGPVMLESASPATKLHVVGKVTVNRAATFSLVTGASGRTARTGGAYFDEAKLGDRLVGGGQLSIDTGAFPISRGTVSISATEALAHEIGHAVGSLMPGISGAFDARLGGAATRTIWTMGEGYSMAWENRWRVEVLGVAPNDLRIFYNQAGDVLHDSSTPLFP